MAATGSSNITTGVICVNPTAILLSWIEAACQANAADLFIMGAKNLACTSEAIQIFASAPHILYIELGVLLKFLIINPYSL